MSAAKPKVRLIRWLPPAENSLLGIVGFIAEDKPEAAAVFAGQVRSAVASLATLPHRARAGRVATTRELVVHPSYIVGYRVTAETVDILRIRHAAQAQ